MIKCKLLSLTFYVDNFEVFNITLKSGTILKGLKFMKKCVILLNAYSKMKEPLNQANRLKDELFKLGVLADIKRNDGFLLGI